MNIQYSRFSLGLISAWALILCQISQPASAQTGNQSDVTGAIVTTGDITGGAFFRTRTDFTGTNIITGDVKGGVFSPSTNGGRVIQGVVFAKRLIQIAVNQTALNILNRLSLNSFTSLSGQPIPIQTQRTLLGLLTSKESVQLNTDSDPIAKALSGVPGSSTAEQAQQLVNSLRGLLQTDRSKQTRLANGQVNAIRLVGAVNAYNNLINNSSAQFLNNPSPELQAIQSVLLQLVNPVSSVRG
jgi:hypothetical protein